MTYEETIEAVLKRKQKVAIEIRLHEDKIEGLRSEGKFLTQFLRLLEEKVEGSKVKVAHTSRALITGDPTCQPSE
jgi:hypothetical protein